MISIIKNCALRLEVYLSGEARAWYLWGHRFNFQHPTQLQIPINYVFMHEFYVSIFSI